MADRYRSQVREVINRNTIVSLALEQGYNVFLPVYDGGVDFIFYREQDGEIRKVQLKGRWTIDRKYVGRDIWIAFPASGEWYLIRHDEMVSVAESQGFTRTSSWTDVGTYNLPRPSKAVMELCFPHKFASLKEVADEAAAEAEK